jgi:hypothetical protein
MINPMNNSTTYRQWMISSQHSSDSAAVRATKNFNQESPRNPQRVVERDNITKAQDNKAEGELVRPQNQNRQ